MRSQRMTSGILVVALWITLSTAALATPVILNQFKQTCKPKAGTALDQAMCLSCHVKMGDKKLNAFGLDIKAAMGKQKTKVFNAAVWAKVAARDSDHDGARNKAEIAKGTLPANAKSK